MRIPYIQENYPNEVVESGNDEFYISYNIIDHMIYGSITTAIVIGQMQHFYILNGDHRKEYAALIPKGLIACLTYFLEHSDLINKYSEKVELLQ